MVVTTKLFGLALAPLYAAIAQVESDRGATSANVYQLRTLYIADVNRIVRDWNRNANASGVTPFPIFTAADRTDEAMSREMMAIFWTHYGRVYVTRTGKPVTYEVLARIHNGGPYGWRKPSTKRYWLKVKAAMEKDFGSAENSSANLE